MSKHHTRKGCKTKSQRKKGEVDIGLIAIVIFMLLFILMFYVMDGTGPLPDPPPVPDLPPLFG